MDLRLASRTRRWWSSPAPRYGVRFASVVIGQRTVVHHLQQNIEHVRMRFLDFVQQQHRMWMLDDRISQQTALIKTNVSRRRTNSDG